MQDQSHISARYTPLLPAWKKLWDWIVKNTGKNKPNSAWRKLSKLVAWCSHHSIDIQDLNTKHTEAFYHWLMKESNIKRPRAHYSAIRKSWQDLHKKDRVPSVAFYNPSKKWTRYGIRMADMPTNLREPLQDLEARSQNEHSENRQLRLKEKTLKARLGSCERFFGFVQHELQENLATISIDQLFENRKYLIAFHNFKVNRKNGKIMVGHLDELKNLKWVAERYVSQYRAPIDMGWLDRYIKKASKNAERRPDYGQYVSEEDVENVIQELQQQLEMEKKFSPQKRLPLARDLFAIQFFFDHGNRTSDLVNAKWDKEFIREGSDIRCHFRTKNNPNERFTLSIQSVMALQKYEDIKVEMNICHTSILITRNGKPITREQLYEQIKRRFENILKIPFSTHWFRYTFLTGELKRHGDPALAALRLGNKSPQTALKHYDRLAPEQAATKWHEILYAEFRDGPGGLLHWAKELLRKAENDVQISDIIKKILQNQGGQK